MNPFAVRPAEEKDLDRLVEIHGASYPDPRGYEERVRNFTHNPLGGLEDLRVVTGEGRVLGHGFLFSGRMWIYGGELLVGALASIAVAPEARGRGAASALVLAMHRELEGRGASLALLYAFNESFYARLGYATTAPFAELTIASSSLAELVGSWGSPADDEGTLVALDSSWIPEMQRVYQLAARSAAGRIDRSEARLGALLANERQHFTGLVGAGGKLEGYVACAYDAPVLHGRTTLIVEELVTTRETARRSLLAFLARQYHQVDDVELVVPMGDPLLFAFRDASGSRRGTPAIEHPLGTLGAGPMVHLVNPRRALVARRYLGDGELSIGWRDGSKNHGDAVKLVVRGARGELGDPEPDPRIDLTLETLGSIVAAGLLPSHAAELGLLRASSRAALELADGVFRGPRFQCLDIF
jgi:predicted acetyltransferase